MEKKVTENEIISVNTSETENKLMSFIKNILKKINWFKFFFILAFFFLCYLFSELLNGNEVLFLRMIGFHSTVIERFEAFNISINNIFRAPKFIVNYLLFIFLYFVIYGITNRTKMSCTIIAVFTFIFGIVNYIITDLRGMSITISDIYSFKTAMNVAKGVKPNIEGNFIIATLLFIMDLIILYTVMKNEDITKNLKTKSITVIIGVFGIIALFGPNYFTDEVELWNVNRAYANSGAGLTIARMAKDLKVKKPCQYNSGDVEQILSKYSDDSELLSNEEYPNIVVIMNESFADLDSVYDIKDLSDDPISFFHELMNEENVISGVMHSSQFGGGTANVEYEFITENITAFLPAGSMPYQQYIAGDIKQSIVSYMNKLGYETYGMHSWNKSGYSREKIYRYLGFDNSMFRESMPQLRHWIGEYPTDESLYEAYYDIMNNKEKDKKNFSFIVTMQNHMPYVYTLDGAVEFVSENDAAISYFQAEYQADKALKQLVEYLKNYDEKTIILFFGDHQPNINQEYWYNVKNEYEQDEAPYIVPFFVWANYDIEEKKGIETSANFLENILLDITKMPKDSYTKYIDEIREELPVITNLYYKDKDGNKYYISDKNSPYYDKLQEYWRVVYYQMFER